MTALGVFRDDYYNSASALPVGQYVARTDATGATLPASAIAGGQLCVLAESGQTTAVALTTDTAVNIIARLQNCVYTQLQALNQLQTSGAPAPGVPNLLNLNYELNIINNNTSSGAITLTGGTGVTITGTATIAIAASRAYLVTVTGPTSISLQNIGSGGV